MRGAETMHGRPGPGGRRGDDERDPPRLSWRTRLGRGGCRTGRRSHWPTVTDEAPAFDPTRVPEPDLSIPPEHRRPGGMGIHLIREATDRLEHEPRPRWRQYPDVGPAPRSTPEGGAFMSMQTTIAGRRCRPDHDPCPDGELDASNFRSHRHRSAPVWRRHAAADHRPCRPALHGELGLVALHSIVQIMHGEEPLDPKAAGARSMPSAATSRQKSDWRVRSPRSNGS